jgi:hypothetical protein
VNNVLATAASSVTIKTLFSDNGAGLGQMAFSTDGGNTFSTPVPYAASATVALPAPDGLYTIAVKVIDLAGNTFVKTQTIRRDTIGPTATYSLPAPTNAGSYDLVGNITLNYSATDVDYVASVSATLDSSTAIATGGAINLYTLASGSHSIVIKATDLLGNTSSTTVTFQVHATISGLTNAVNYGVTNKLISNALQSSLFSTLQSAQSALNAGNTTSEKKYLNQFITQIQSAGSKITSSFSALLLNWTQDLINRS